MRSQLKLLISTSLTLFIALQALSQNTGDISSNLIKKWYAVKVGEPEGGEMMPTSKSEIFTFNSDGTLNIEERNYNIEGKWEYLDESKIIKVTLNFDGNERVVELTVRNLTDKTLILVSPQKATEY